MAAAQGQPCRRLLHAPARACLHRCSRACSRTHRAPPLRRGRAYRRHVPARAECARRRGEAARAAAQGETCAAGNMRARGRALTPSPRGRPLPRFRVPRGAGRRDVVGGSASWRDVGQRVAQVARGAAQRGAATRCNRRPPSQPARTPHAACRPRTHVAPASRSSAQAPVGAAACAHALALALCQQRRACLCLLLCGWSEGARRRAGSLRRRGGGAARPCPRPRPFPCAHAPARGPRRARLPLAAAVLRHQQGPRDGEGPAAGSARTVRRAPPPLLL